MTPKLLDAFCGAGGAAKGYQRAGFYVVGVDHKPQPRYCGDGFILGDALEYVKAHGHEFDAIHASPPCQAHSFASMFNHAKSRHADLLEPTREALRIIGAPWVIENVIGADLDGLVLCGTMFGLGVFRHRRFESSELILQPLHVRHPNRATPMRKRSRWQPGEFLTVTGHFAYPLAQVQQAMGIDWMKHDDITQAIPPAYTEFIGRGLLATLAAEAHSA